MTDGEVSGDPTARSLTRPEAAAAASFVEAALARGRVVTVVGECEEAAPEGDRPAPAARLAVLKPDGAVVVHGREGTAPEAAFDGAGRPDVAAVDGDLTVGADGGEPRLRFTRVDRVASVAADPTRDVDAGRDEAEPGPDRHGDLRARLVAEPDLVEPGFRPRSTERETPAGPVDLFGRDAEGRAVVVEVKAHRAGPAAVGQLDRYVAALGRDLHADSEVRGVLVAPSATDRARRLLAERGLEFRALSTAR